MPSDAFSKTVSLPVFLVVPYSLSLSTKGPPPKPLRSPCLPAYLRTQLLCAQLFASFWRTV